MDNIFPISTFIPEYVTDKKGNDSGKTVCESDCQCEPVCKKCNCDSMCAYNIGDMMHIIDGSNNPWTNDYYNRF